MNSGDHLFRQVSGGPPPSVAGTDSTASAGVGTPMYDALVAALATGADTDGPADGRGAGTHPAVVPAPDLGEGAAILALFSRIKDIEEPDDGWPGGDVVSVLCGWFAEMGIDVDGDPAAAARTLRLPSGLSNQHTHGSDFTVRVRAGHAAADADVRTWVSALVTALGRHSSAVVFDATGEQIAHCTHPDTDPGQH